MERVKISGIFVMVDLTSYKTWVFDCDGVVLDSNRVKTEAFYKVAESYGTQYAEALVEHHVKNGGVSRYVKLRRFLTDILGRAECELDELETLLAGYAAHVQQGLLSCPVASDIRYLRELTSGANWLIVSGGDQEELRAVFRERNLEDLFDGGIYGSPQNKDEILARLKNQGVIKTPAIFVGDSQYDYEAARAAALDFIFVSDWSESGFDFDNADLKFGSLSDIASGLKSLSV